MTKYSHTLRKKIVQDLEAGKTHEELLKRLVTHFPISPISR